MVELDKMSWLRNLAHVEWNCVSQNRVFQKGKQMESLVETTTVAEKERRVNGSGGDGLSVAVKTISS